MGCYINPPDMTKEEWLQKYGQRTGLEPTKITQTHVPVILINNGLFTAAGIGYHPLEVQEFVEGTHGRPFTWWKVKREDARKVSPLDIYESENPPDSFSKED